MVLTIDKKLTSELILTPVLINSLLIAFLAVTSSFAVSTYEFF